MKGEIVAAAQTTPTPTTAATATPTGATSGSATPTSAALPQTGGAPAGDGGASAMLYALLALGGALLAGSGLTFAFARRRA
jgi:hypothetical protein